MKGKTVGKLQKANKQVQKFTKNKGKETRRIGSLSAGDSD